MFLHPACAGALEPVGFTPRPEIGAISMSGSSVLVALNALALNRLRLPETPSTWLRRQGDLNQGRQSLGHGRSSCARRFLIRRGGCRPTTLYLPKTSRKRSDGVVVLEGVVSCHDLRY